MKNPIKLVMLALICITFGFTEVEKKVLVIDVGHGGADHGAMLDNVNEKDLALAIAEKIKDVNTKSKLEIVLTRTSDEFISLEDRAKFINSLNPDYVISLHFGESSDKTANGKAIYYSLKNTFTEESNQLADKLRVAFSDDLIEVKEADFFILKNVHSPALLIELGYLSNPLEREELIQEESQLAIAQCILNALLQD